MQNVYDFSVFDPSITSKKLSLVTNKETLISKTPGKIYLLIDHYNKIRGIDTFVSCSFEEEKNDHVVKYISYENKNKNVFNINLKQMFSNYKVYEVNDLDFAHKYSDEALHSACLTWDQGEIFDYLYGQTGTNLYSCMMKLVQADIKARINFLDLTKKHKHNLHSLCFLDTREDISEKAKDKIKSDIDLMLK